MLAARKDATQWRTQTLKGGIPDVGSLATEIPSFYLSAGLQPVGTDRRAGTGRHHSRTLASSRTSRVEAERSLPPAGRRLTGRRRRPSAGAFNECTYMVVLFYVVVLVDYAMWEDCCYPKCSSFCHLTICFLLKSVVSWQFHEKINTTLMSVKYEATTRSKLA